MLDPAVLAFLFAFAAIFWVGIFVLTSNPYNTLSRVGASLLFCLSLYLLSGAFLFSSHSLGEFRNIFRINAFTIYFPAAIWLQVSVLMLKKSDQKKWKFLVLLGYMLALIFSLLEFKTDLVLNYDKVIYPVSRFKYIYAKGPLFFIAIGFVLSYFFLTSRNLLELYKKAKNGDEGKLKYLFPLVTSLIFATGLILIVSTFVLGPIREVKEAGEMIVSLAIVLLAANVFFNRLFLDGAKTNLGKEFLYSTFTVTVIVLVYLGTLLSFQVKFGIKNLIFLSIFILLVLLTHTTYDWIMSFVRNIFQGDISFPRVTDEEVNTALRNLQRPERLEASTLMRLKSVASSNPKPSLDKLRDLIKESVEYFKPDDDIRTKAALKYNILKMISDQVEEGQILWDLGFEEYPLGIAENGNGNKPRFAISSPTDYQATSRNAFITLKKEAIHDLAWRISYLEKHFK